MPDNATLYATSFYNSSYKNANYVLLTASWIKEEKFSVNLEYSDPYIYNVFISTDFNTASGDPSGTQYQYGTRVYYYIQTIKNTEQYYYTINNATQVCDRTFLIDSIVVEKDIKIALPKVERKEQFYKIKYSCGEGVEIEIWGVTETGWGPSTIFKYNTEATVQITLIGDENYIYLPNFEYDRVYTEHSG